MLREFVKKHYGLVDAPEASKDMDAASVEEPKVELQDEKKESFGTVEGADGTIYNFPGDSLTEGGGPFLEGETEGEGDAKVGETELANGDTIVTGEDGIVTEIIPADGEEEEAPEAPAEEEEEMEEEAGSVEQILEALTPLFEQIDQRISALETSNQELESDKEKLSKELEAEKAKSEKLSKAPAAEKFTAKSNATKAQKSFNRASSVHERLANKLK